MAKSCASGFGSVSADVVTRIALSIGFLETAIRGKPGSAFEIGVMHEPR
jgi:hypothetical protein